MAKGNEAWSLSKALLLACREMKRKEQFYAGQQLTTQGFMRLAWRSIGMLKQMAKDPVIRMAFWEQPLVKRFAFAAVKFINRLAGPQCQELEARHLQNSVHLFSPGINP